jgi:hypothetical protein
MIKDLNVKKSLNFIFYLVQTNSSTTSGFSSTDLTNTSEKSIVCFVAGFV